MSDTVEQIKSRLDIVDVISGYLKVQKAGSSYKARCPFHNEKTPSFHISPERQSWHCFGCSKGGDMFSFVQEIEGIEFVEAMRLLAGKANVTVPEYRAGATAQKADTRAPLLAVAEQATKFFAKQLWQSNAGARALAYLHERGLTDETIKAWQLGWAPNDWRALTGFLQEAGHSNTAIVGAGMAIDKNGRVYDRFRSRIMFPIADANGRVVGFTGRVFGAEVAVDGEPLAKYVNTPQTAIYDKSSILFGLDKAKLAMRQQDSCLLVEGNMDAIMSWQAGATHVVATSGTALTPQQLKLLGRYSTNLAFCFDTDQAGQTATRRGIGLALVQRFDISIIAITDTECKDPADYVKKYGARWNEVVVGAQPVLDYYYTAALAGYDPGSAQSKKAILASVGPFLKRLASKVEESHWIDKLAMLLRVDQSSVRADIATMPDDITQYERGVQEKDEAPTQPSTPVAPLDPVSAELLALLARHPQLVEQAAGIDRILIDARVAAVLDDPTMLTPEYQGEHRHLIDTAFMRASDVWQGWTPQELQAQLTVLSARLRQEQLRAKLAQLHLAVRQAEASHDAEALKNLLTQFAQYQYELNQLQNVSTS